MRFRELSVSGAHLVEVEWHEDARGSFARAFCAREFEAHGLGTGIVQCNLSRTRQRGVVRGLHYQESPALEAKLVRCTVGATFHALVDLRPDSATFGRTAVAELRAEAASALHVPALCAHGHQTLTDGAEILYMVTGFYNPDHERGIRHDDPALGIEWPLPVIGVSAKDRSWPLLDGAFAERGEA